MAKKKTTIKKPAPKKASPKKTKEQTRQQETIIGFSLLAIGFLFLASLLSFLMHWQSDQSQLGEFFNRQIKTHNIAGKLGAFLGDKLIYNGFGIAAISISILLMLSGTHYILKIKREKLFGYWLWGIFNLVWLSIFFGFIFSSKPLLGGKIGYEITHFLKDYIGNIGIGLLLFATFIFYLAQRFRLTPEHIAKAIPKRKKNQFLDTNDIADDDKESFTANHTDEELEIINEFKAEVKEEENTTETFINKAKNLKPTISNYSEINKNEDKNPLESKLQIEVPQEEETIEETKLEVEPLKKDDLVNKNVANDLVAQFGEFDPRLELADYKFPKLELLKKYNNEHIQIDEEELENNKNKIVKTLLDYKIEISDIKAKIGPTVTLYEIIPAAGVRISKIKNLEDDIALSLAALGIRIIAPMPGKGTIGIEVPNKKPTIVSMHSVIASKKFQTAEMELPIALGKTISNDTFVIDLAKMPHLLMAGATGQGKSVGLNAVLTSLLYKKHPAEVKFVLVDPKKVELTLYNKIERHFLAKLPGEEEAIITDTSKVVSTLNSLCIEMDDRYDLLKNALVRNIKEYNVKFKNRKLSPENGHHFLPYIVLVIDEFADLIMTAGKEVETPIARLAQLARAVGIHLIVATQRPSVNVITGIIKANFPTRVAFRVTSKIDSRTILDAGGADQLIGKGDMLISTGSEIVRLQCAFVDTPEVESITDFIGAQRAYNDAHLLPEYVGEESGTSIDVDIKDRDKLFEEAAKIIVISQQGSTSLLQRKLKLGYNRAGRIIDQLEAAGIVGQFEGSKARQVLVPDLVELERLLANELL
jgi:S-DNA-T family DNA segregation ATPase FtsK/SpoIIIE